ncbi:MAG: hypothetical protein AAF984_04850 [Verrucomicrobiota bacterium]
MLAKPYPLNTSDDVSIDINISSKAPFDVTLPQGAQRTKVAKFKNTDAGFIELSQWGVEPLHRCLETTNINTHDLVNYRRTV